MATELPPAETRQTTFEQAVAMTLHLWPALSLAVENNWGGPDSSEKRDWFAGVLVDQFPEITTTTSGIPTDPSAPDVSGPDQVEYIETMLVQVMTDEFELAVDDDSPYEIAQAIVALRNQCLVGNFTEAEAVAERFRRKKDGRGTSGIQRVEAPEDDDSEDSGDWEDSEDEDDDMDDAPQLVHAPKEKSEPEIDEDGFTTVVNKKRR